MAAAKAVPTGLYADNISIASSDLVKIHVGGASPDEVSVHRDVICSTSEFLKNVNWLYTGIVRVVEGQLGSAKEYTLLGQLYLIGTTLKDAKFRNAIVSVLLRSAREPKSGSAKCLPNHSCINSAYNPAYLAAGLDQRALQRALVEIYASEEDSAYLLAVKDKVERNFLSDLSMRLMEMRLAKHKNMFEVRDCAFHEHKPKEKCEVQQPAKNRRREQ
ncbi:hypothetical protein M409DRAFT_19982 [Zasmidium cellare ATCC 36951]|uniref:Uncharacterized protein n=1 Tax=Zasmidium cellare ATCC 36951 TaxID=1080233 RepID=A0A6A6CR71_ZASCE|nr:uncharacterized protein M409DRAFT_19982 [Zasmidium cellare ATCC 36951]KAF2169571.1 hypothetical protein M409DRAFT_19982 [Zasmidium cellare ATCC 36951]